MKLLVSKFFIFFTLFFLLRCEGEECIDFGAGVCKQNDILDQKEIFSDNFDSIFVHDIKEVESEFFGNYPPDASKSQIEALKYVNKYRSLVGLPFVDEKAEINCAAQNHANYYIIHYNKYKQGFNTHLENKEWAEGFTGETFADRMEYCGYKGMPGWEIIAFVNHPKLSVDEWMETLYHRIPIIHPQAIEMGYGNAAKGGYAQIDVMNFGRGVSALEGDDIIYPVDGQENVPILWDGLEWPQPLPPPDGYPSGPIITIIFRGGLGFKIEEHILLENEETSLLHVFLAPYADKEKGIEKDPLLSREIAMYAYKPLKPLTKYRVIIKGTKGGKFFEKQWTFKTAKK